MAVESGARTSNTLSGELRSRPLAVLLAGACERRTSGTFAFRHGERHDSLTMHAGKIAVVHTSEPVAYLGGILYELGAIDMDTLDATLLEVARARRLHGDILTEQGAVTRERVEEGLIEQTYRKVVHLFSLPEETTWTFREDVDELTGKRDEDRPAVETWLAIWRALREQPPAPHVRRTLAKIDGGIHLKDLRGVSRFGLTAEEMALCERLYAQPSTVESLVKTSPLAAERTALLVYLLALARCIVRVEAQPVSPAELGIAGVRERAKRIDEEDAFAMLGLRKDASLEAARAAYFRLARLWHPDKIPESLHAVRSECEHVFIRLGEAHRILTDVAARKRAESIVGRGNTAAANDSTAPPAARSSMRDIDAAIARNDISAAIALARLLTSAGAEGPAARAVIAWCGAGTDPEAVETALAGLDKVLTGDPDCVRALYYRGQALKRLGRTEAALREFKKVARLDPRHVDALREVRLHVLRTTQAQVTPPAATAAVSPASPPGERSGLRRLLARVAGK